MRMDLISKGWRRGQVTKVCRILTFLALVLTSTACTSLIGRTITVKVVDGEGKPVDGAKVGMGFYRSHGGDQGEGITNEEGMVSIRGNDTLGVRTSVTKNGYYESETRIGGDASVEERILLREKQNPISMYVQEVSLNFPEENVKMGFDLRAGDWVAPWGDGNEAHIYFSFKGDKRDPFNKKGFVSIEFANGKGGLKRVEHPGIASFHKFPYKAPENGYTNSVNHVLRRDKAKEGLGSYESSLKPDTFGYIFKVVTKINAKGKVEEAYYGKIRDDFVFAPLKPQENNGSHGFIRFTYYLNPEPNDRNIEFARGSNLFENVEYTFPP